MITAINQFNKNIQYIRELHNLYNHIEITLSLPNDLTDLLRAEIVFAVSALDKLIHNLVRVGMMETFDGRRMPTEKYKTFKISLNTFNSFSSSSRFPPSYWFEQEIINQHKHLSFQDSQKIKNALSLIWHENHKWQKLATRLSMTEHDLNIQLKTAISRRNQIVHEADLDIVTGNKNTLDSVYTVSVVDFIEQLGQAIYEEVK